MSASLESLMPDAATATARSPLAELLLFIAVGGSGAIAFVVLSTALTGLSLGLPAWAISALCWAVLIGPVYLLHRQYSFRSKSPHGVALPRYIAVQMVALTLASAFSYVCYALLGLQGVVAALLVVGLTSGVNFFVLKLWAFAAPH